jgi:hypothetical protein
MERERGGSGLDPVRTAVTLVYYHGPKALKVAATRANHLAESGDKDGALEWLEISEAVAKLTQHNP